VLLSVAESKNIHSEIIPKISTGFCGGLARTCGICGAVSGAIMSINLFYGRNLPNEPYDKSYVPVQKMINTFENKFGSTNCKVLIGVDLGTEEGLKKFLSENKVEQCKNFTEEATRMAMSIIEGKI
jgi:C_GCAxxG_C_C family probable redox protein